MPLRYRLLQALVPLLLLAPAASAQTFVEYFEIPGAPTLHGLDYHDGFLWAAVRSSTEPRLLQLDPADGSVVATVPIDGAFSPLGVTWDGTDFWVSRTFSPSASVFRVSPTGEVLGQIPAPSALTNGLAWQGGTLWAAKAYPDDEAALVAVDPADGSVLDTVPFPSTQPGGIAFLDATTVWTTNVGDDSGSDVEVLWKIDLTTGDVLQTLELPTGAGRPRGLAYDGSQYLYAVMDEPGGFDDVVYKIDLGGAGNPVYSATATAVSFTPTVIGTTAERTFTLFNEGDAPLEIFDVQIVQIPEQDDVFATDLADTVIEAGGQRVVTVTFTPTGFGSKFGQYEAFLIFSTNDIATPSVEVPLTGIGAYAEQHVGFVVPFHDFGPVRIEDPYGDDRSVALWPLQLINQGLEPLTVSAITLSDPAFALAGVDLPMTVAPLDTVAVPIAFAPPSVGPYAATATVATDDPTNPAAEVGLQGEGIDPDLSGGDALWTYLVPDNPATSFQDKKVSSVKSLGDVTGDGAPDLVVVTENYYTLALNGNGWGAADTLWSFSTCPDNFNCGSVDGNAGLYETGLVAGADLNGDGFGDAVIATGGGNDHVYALDGTDGSVLWSLGDDGDPYLAAYTSLSLRFDVTGDGVPEIAATTGTASASSPNPYNQRRVYLLDGATGGVVWTAHPGIPNFVSAQIEAGGGPLVVAGGRNEGVEAHVTAYEAGSGVAAWTIGPAVAPFVMVPLALPGGTEDLVYGGFGSQSGSGGLARVDGATGEEVWSDYTYGSVVWDLAVLGDVDGDDVPDLLLGSTKPFVYVLSGADGSVLWFEARNGQVFDVAAVPDLDGDGIMEAAATGNDGLVVLYAGATGDALWSYVIGDGTFDTSGEVTVAVPDVDGNGLPEIAAATRDGRVALLLGSTAPGTDAAPGATPAAFTLDGNYPNPFAGATTVRYALAEPARVRLVVYDLLGRRVRTLVDAEQPAATHEVRWDGRDGTGAPVAAGVYLCRIEAGGAERTFTDTRRMVLVR